MENDVSQQFSFNQHHIYELSSEKVSFCEFGNIVSLENLHLSPNLFSEIQILNSEIGEHVIVEKVHEIRIGEDYQAGLPNNINNNINNGMTFDDDEFTEGELVSYPNQKREREEPDENEFDLTSLSLLEDRIGSPKKKCCLELPNRSLAAPTFDLSDNYPVGESLFHTFGSIETIFMNY